MWLTIKPLHLTLTSNTLDFCMKKYISLGLGALCLIPVHAFAENITNTAQVLSSCSMRKVQDINFGVFNPFVQNTRTAKGEIELTCTKGTYRVSLGAGSGAGWFTNTKQCFYQMKNQQGKSAIYYPSASFSETTTGALNPTAASEAGCSSASVFLKNYTFTETVRSQIVSVYAMTEKSQFFGGPHVGTYTDTLTVLVTF